MGLGMLGGSQQNGHHSELCTRKAYSYTHSPSTHLLVGEKFLRLIESGEEIVERLRV
jgi:hypothetical protein